MTKSVYMETYGCSANQSHSEVMLGLLKGYRIVKTPEKADILIINTCTVKEHTEKKVLNRIRRLREEFPNKEMIIAGCMPIAQHNLFKTMKASLLGPHNCLDIAKCVKETLEGRRVEYLDRKGESKLCIEKQRFNPYIDIVEISQGCLGNCSYCIVKDAKGRLKSCSVSDIIRDIETSLKEGCKEIWLTSQDCGCYGIDFGSSLIKLLRKVTEINGDFRVRLGMSNPNHIKLILSDLIEIYGNKKLYKFLHIPVQSGSDKVLRDMKRQYVTKDFLEITAELRDNIPGVTIWTDVIVGFPGETDKDFNETIRVIKETKPDFVNISKFGMRPGTEAEKMEQIPKVTVKKRSRQVSDLVDKLSLEMNKRWVGKTCHILVTELGKNKSQYIGRNEAYKPVIIESRKSLLGKFVTVRIKDARKTHLVAKPAP